MRGSAQAAWLDAIYSADVTAMTTLHTAWNIDFTQHHVDLATAKQTWWSGFRSNFLSYVSDVTNEWQTEQTSANLAWGTYSAAMGAAQSACATAEQDAVRGRRVLNFHRTGRCVTCGLDRASNAGGELGNRA